MRQIIGIPMGKNCGPGFDNLYLYGYESKFVDNLCLTGRIEISKQFDTAFSLIDDTLSVDNPHWSEFAERSFENGGIYPQALTQNKTHLNALSTNFLGMHVNIKNNGLLELPVYDERKEFGLKNSAIS